MFNTINSTRNNKGFANMKIITNIIIILVDNYIKFFYKIYKKYISLDNL